MHTHFADNFFILNFAFLRIFKQCLKNYLRYIGHLCLQKRGGKERKCNHFVYNATFIKIPENK